MHAEEEMRDAPKGMRPHIVLLGRRNAGKSSLLNVLSGQNMAIVSDNPGTTTDPVEKTMEFGKSGPVVFIDTAGIDDSGHLGNMRVDKSLAAASLADLAIIVTDNAIWEEPENFIASYLENLEIPFLIAKNKSDLSNTDSNFPQGNFGQRDRTVSVSANKLTGIDELRRRICDILAHNADEVPLVADILPDNGLALLVVPIDSGAPKGRLILPQAQTIRDCLDNKKFCLVTTAGQYTQTWDKLAQKPDLVICDSQVVKQVVRQTPDDIMLTTFSILMARHKGDLEMFARGAKSLKDLAPGSRVLIQEACSHHPQKDDIGRIKIPALLRKLAGGELDIHFSAGRHIPFSDGRWDLMIHCGGCMLTRKQMTLRQKLSRKADCPMTNYGMAISFAQGVLEKTLEMFPGALRAYKL